MHMLKSRDKTKTKKERIVMSQTKITQAEAHFEKEAENKVKYKGLLKTRVTNH